MPILFNKTGSLVAWAPFNDVKYTLTLLFLAQPGIAPKRKEKNEPEE